MQWLLRPVRNTARSLHRHQHFLHPRGRHLHAGADRPRGRPVKCVANRRSATEHRATDRPGQRPPKSSGSRRSHQRGQKRQRRSVMAATEQELPLHVRGPPDSSQDELPPVGHRCGESRDAAATDTLLARCNDLRCDHRVADLPPPATTSTSAPTPTPARHHHGATGSPDDIISTTTTHRRRVLQELHRCQSRREGTAACR